MSGLTQNHIRSLRLGQIALGLACLMVGGVALADESLSDLASQIESQAAAVPVRKTSVRKHKKTPVPSVQPSLRPNWAKSSLEVAERPNISFLSNRKYAPGSPEAQILDRIFDPRTTAETRYRYERLLQDYETSQARTIGGMEIQKTYVDHVTDLRNEVVNKTRQRHVRAGSQKLLRAAEDSETLQAVREPVAVVATAAAIYYGQPVSLNVTDSTRLSARAYMPNQEGQFKMYSPLLNTTLDFAGNVPVDPNQLNFDPTQRKERYKLSMDRGLPVLDLQSGLSYGWTSNLVTASLSKQLTPSVKFVLDSSRALRSNPASAGLEQESLKLFYDLRF